MKSKSRLRAIIAVTLLAVVGVVRAAPVDFKDIDADATWLAHLDVDAASSSQVVKAVLANCLATHDNEGPLGEFLERIELDPHKDLHGITLYGPTIAPGEAVAIVHARLNMNTILRQLKRAPDHDTLDYRDYHIHTWTKHHWTRYPREVAATFYKPDVFVLASSVDLLKKALDVLDAKTPSLAGKDSPLTAQVPAGAVLIVRAVAIDKADLRGRFPVTQLLRRFQYTAGEHEGKWFKDVLIEADSPQTAEKLKQVVEGHRAMFWLHFHNRPEVLAVLDDLKLNVEGSTLHVSLSDPVEKIIAAVPAVCNAIQEHFRWHARSWMQMEAHRRWHNWLERQRNREPDRDRDRDRD
jgi:hypothetical protein